MTPTTISRLTTFHMVCFSNNEIARSKILPFKSQQHSRKLTVKMATTSNHVVSSGSEASDNEDTKGAILPKSRVLRKMNTVNGSRGSRHSSRNRPSSRVKRPIKHFVNHNYHDHLHRPVVSSCDPVGSMGSISGENKEESSQHRRSSHRGGVATPFPEKLHYMLSRMEPEGTASIASWQPHGRCFLVHKPKEFVQEIMPM
jgi:hypothetical protein